MIKRTIVGEKLNGINFIDNYQFYVKDKVYLRCKSCNATAKIIEEKNINGKKEVIYEYRVSKKR